MDTTIGWRYACWVGHPVTSYSPFPLVYAILPKRPTLTSAKSQTTDQFPSELVSHKDPKNIRWILTVLSFPVFGHLVYHHLHGGSSAADFNGHGHEYGRGRGHRRPYGADAGHRALFRITF